MFSVVLLPTSEQDKYRWHIFSYNSQNQKVELTTIPGSDDGLFDLKDYTVLDPESRSIPGIIQRTLDLGNITVAKGLTATKYDLQRERQTDDGMQLLKQSVRILLAVGTSEGNVATISFAAVDGTLSQIKDKPDSTTILHSTTRQILLPLDTLEQIKALSNSNPPPQGMIARIARGEEDGVVLTSDKATRLDEAKITQVKVEGNQDYNRLYSQVTKIDDNTFKEKQATLEKETKAAQAQHSEAVTKKQSEIDKQIQDQEKKSHATASFASWQKKMEDIQIRARKRNIVNTYVWDADGGLRSEAQSFANTAEHSIGGSFSLNAGLGFEGKFAGGGVRVELTAQATINLTQTMSKTETRSKGIELNVDLSGVENRGLRTTMTIPSYLGKKWIVTAL